MIGGLFAQGKFDDWLGPSREQWLEEARDLMTNPQWQDEQRSQLLALRQAGIEHWFYNGAGIAADGTMIFACCHSSHHSSTIGDINIFRIGSDEFITDYHLCEGTHEFNLLPQPENAADLIDLVTTMSGTSP